MNQEPIDLDAIAETAKLVTEAIKPVVEAVGSFLQQMTPSINAVYEAAYQEYLDAGAPYGEGYDGMMRWREELAKVERLRWEADEIIQKHKDLVSFRQMVTQPQATNGCTCGGCCCGGSE